MRRAEASEACGFTCGDGWVRARVRKLTPLRTCSARAPRVRATLPLRNLVLPTPSPRPCRGGWEGDIVRVSAELNHRKWGYEPHLFCKRALSGGADPT